MFQAKPILSDICGNSMYLWLGFISVTHNAICSCFTALLFQVYRSPSPLTPLLLFFPPCGCRNVLMKRGSKLNLRPKSNMIPVGSFDIEF